MVVGVHFNDEVKKAKGEKISDFEVQVATELHSIEMAHDDLKAKHADRALALESAEAAGGSAAAQLQASEAMAKELQEQLDDARSQVSLP